jgi:DHA2 family multidrug resistance protein-like MFS transporter
MSAASLADGLDQPRRNYAIAAILLSVVLSMMDGAILNVALPSIMRELHISEAAAIWLVNGYQLILVVAVLPLAALGESLGFRRVFTGGLWVFVLASILCAVAPGWPMLFAGRLLQGLGAAGLMSAIPALLRLTYPASQLGRGIGLNALFVAIATGLGPTLGSAILSVATWPWLFVVNLPLGALALLAARSLPASAGRPNRLEPLSVALNVLVLGCLVLGIDALVRAPLAAAALLAVALLGGLAFLRRESRRPAPLVPFDLLAIPSLGLSALASLCVWVGQSLAVIALPFHFHAVLGPEVLRIGLLMTLWPAAVAATAPVAGRLADRYSSAAPSTLGVVLLGAGLAGLVLLQPQGVVGNGLLMVLCGLGFGLFQAPNNRAIILAAPAARGGGAGAIQVLARQLGQSLGAASAAALFAVTPLAGGVWGIAGAAGCMGLALLACLRRGFRDGAL